MNFLKILKKSFEETYKIKINLNNNWSLFKSILIALWGPPKNGNLYNWFEQIFIFRLFKNILVLFTELSWKLLGRYLSRYLVTIPNNRYLFIFLIRSFIFLSALFLIIGRRFTSPITSCRNSYKWGYELIDRPDNFWMIRWKKRTLGLLTAALSFFLSLGIWIILSVICAPIIIKLSVRIVGMETVSVISKVLTGLYHFPPINFFSQSLYKAISLVLPLSSEAQVIAPMTIASTLFLGIFGITAKILLRKLFSLCPIYKKPTINSIPLASEPPLSTRIIQQDLDIPTGVQRTRSSESRPAPIKTHFPQNIDVSSKKEPETPSTNQSEVNETPLLSPSHMP